MLRTMTLLACVAALAACGQMTGAKGPDSTSSTTTSSTTTTTAPAAGDNKPADGAAAPAADAGGGAKPSVEQAPAGSTPAKP